MRKRALLFAAVALGLLGFGGWWMYWPHGMGSHSGDHGGPMVQVSVPDLSAEARAGEALFDASCSACHGPNAAGSDQGPPLIHRIYEPNHHADAAFHRAVQLGVQSHHWRFGSMPAVEGVSERDVGKIVRYIREMQRANGIF